MFHKPVFGRKGASGAKPEEKKGFAPLLGALFENTGPQAELGGLTDELKRIEHFGRGLGRKAIRYVATGEPAGFAQELEAIVDKIGRNVWASPYFSESEAKNRTHLQSAVTLAKGEITDPQIIARFVAIRRAVYPYERSLGRSKPDYPDFELLIRELHNLVAQGDRELNQHSYSVDPKPPVVLTVSPREVLRLTCALGGSALHYFKGNTFRSAQLFERRPHFKEEFTQLIKEHPRDFVDAMHTAIDDRGYSAYMKLAEELGILTVSHIMAAVFGLLGKGNSKGVREEAIATLARLDLSILPQALKMGLAEGELEMRYDLVQIAGRVGSDEVLGVLREHLPNEKSGKVKGAIDAILDTKEAVTTEADAASEPGDVKSIKLANGQTYELAPVDESLHAKPDDSEREAFLKFVRLINARRAEQLNDGQERKPHQLQIAQAITDEEADQLFAVLQAGTRSGELEPHLRFWDLHKAAITEEMREALAGFSPALRWRTLIMLGGVSNFKGLVKREYYDHTIISELVREEVEAGLDVLALSKLCEDCHPEHGAQRSAEYAMRKWLAPHPVSYYPWKNPFEDFPKEAAVRIIAANMAVIDEALGLAPSSQVYSLKGTFTVLAMLPALPERYVPKLVELGLTGKNDEREAAQDLLENAQDLPKRLEDALDDRRQDVRANAATWFADIRADNAEKAMRKRLKKEKAEVVRAALIEALLRLGADLSDVIGPDALVKEAEKKGGKLALPEWLTPDHIPQVRFADGSPAPRSLIEYWIGMAVKLKDPGNTGLFGIYLDQLMPEDAKVLSARILQGWIDFDTFGPTLEEAVEYATQKAAQHIANIRSRYNFSAEGEERRRAEAFAYYKRERLNYFPNTGTKSKGILALACRAEPAFAAERVRWFLKKYGRRSHQAMALLDMLAGMNSPTAMQVVIAAATRLKQKSTMAHANAIAERYAKDRGWSYDELADRTVPTAGFDDDGIMELPIGPDEKPYSARIDASLTVHISNPDGKVIKSLPAGDDEVTKESKKALTAGKRELKQIVNMQTHRLTEALAAERQWPVEDWLECFHGHPVMRRLIERLVWQGIDQDGNAQGLLRPTQEGDFTNAGDEDIDVRSFAHIRLAHAALVEPELADAWRAHLKDYEIKPLIDQFPKGFQPFGGEAEDAAAITDRHGWLGESRSYRGIAEKLGYQREIGDGGGTIGYYKTFGATGLTAVIQTNGGHAVDENVSQALKDLIFRNKGAYNGAPLAEVPPVLLAMCHADLHTIARKGAFDEEWEEKSSW